jgi:hypothetical protein
MLGLYCKVTLGSAHCIEKTLEYFRRFGPGVVLAQPITTDTNPEMNVLYGILLSFSSGPKARPIGTRIAGDNPEGHCRCRSVPRRAATSAVLSADEHLAQV